MTMYVTLHSLLLLCQRRLPQLLECVGLVPRTKPEEHCVCDM
jgi:hypothetical protein